MSHNPNYRPERLVQRHLLTYAWYHYRHYYYHHYRHYYYHHYHKYNDGLRYSRVTYLTRLLTHLLTNYPTNAAGPRRRGYAR